jgi:hypothetical protein
MFQTRNTNAAPKFSLTALFTLPDCERWDLNKYQGQFAAVKTK